MDALRFYFLFNSISEIFKGWEVIMCGCRTLFMVERIICPTEIEPETARSETCWGRTDFPVFDYLRV